MENKNYELAHKCLSQSFKINSNYVPTINNLAGYYHKINDPRNAIHYSQLSIKIQPGNPIALDQYAKALIINNRPEEAIDILGGTKCGKIAFKDRSSLTPEQLEQQRTIRCYKLVYGLLSFTNGKTAQGHAHNVENLPILYRVTGTAFTPVSSALDQLKKRRKLMFNCTFSLDTKRQKKGGNVFYVPEISVDADANLQLSDTDMETLKVFQESIDAENKEVVEGYNSAKLKSSTETMNKVDAEIVEDIGKDSPEEILAS